jgi:hypothetical protein
VWRSSREPGAWCYRRAEGGVWHGGRSRLVGMEGWEIIAGKARIFVQFSQISCAAEHRCTTQ